MSRNIDCIEQVTFRILHNYALQKFNYEQKSIPSFAQFSSSNFMEFSKKQKLK